ncbi:MAG: LD-carboxypeptidase [Lachnospiraceae bacterium]|nr:LD-carboxypeptidase [Lachnospiraceae bacterium]
MKYAEFLKDGGCIGFPAPSFGCNIEPYYSCFQHALEFFESKGYKTLPGPNSTLGEGVGISNTPEKCAGELMDMYLSLDNDAIISCGGGELMCEILEHLDFEKLKDADPKWFMGYSDNTSFLLPLVTLCDIAGIYGPCADHFGARELHDVTQTAFDVFCGRKSKVHSYDSFQIEKIKGEEDPLAPFNLTEVSYKSVFDGKKLYAPGKFDGKLKFEGRLIGGCMDILVNLLGTPFEDVRGFMNRYAEDGIIWCLESCDLNVFDIRRAMWHFDKAGWFDKGLLGGFVIGRPENGEEMMGLDHINAVLPVLEKMGVPAVLDADLGHVPPSMPLVFGSIGHVTVSGNDVEIEMEFA